MTRQAPGNQACCRAGLFLRRNGRSLAPSDRGSAVWQSRPGGVIDMATVPLQLPRGTIGTLDARVWRGSQNEGAAQRQEARQSYTGLNVRCHIMNCPKPSVRIRPTPVVALSAANVRNGSASSHRKRPLVLPVADRQGRGVRIRNLVFPNRHPLVATIFDEPHANFDHDANRGRIGRIDERNNPRQTQL